MFLGLDKIPINIHLQFFVRIGIVVTKRFHDSCVNVAHVFSRFVSYRHSRFMVIATPKKCYSILHSERRKTKMNPDEFVVALFSWMRLAPSELTLGMAPYSRMKVILASLD